MTGGPTSFVWLGKHKAAARLHLRFPRETDAGIWNLHAYQYDGGMSTWIVETTAETFARAGLEEDDEEATVAYVASLYEDLLDGHPVITNRSLWRNFPTIRCESWVRDNLVIMGDAAHTAHFSIGFGDQAGDGGRDRAVRGVPRP